MDLPSSAHFIYIPGVVILGLVVGFIWGARLTRESFHLEARRVQEREKKREEKRLQRQEERRARPGTGQGTDGPGADPEGEANQAAQATHQETHQAGQATINKPPEPPVRR